ncbi:MAG: apolipoprotein N-acyltransferase [Sphingomonadaceae bacterium]
MHPLLLAFAAGLVSATGFAPLGLWPLLLVAMAALIRLVGEATDLGQALARGYAFGLGQFLLGLNWIATAFTYQAAMPAWLGWIGVFLLSLYLAVFPAAAAGLAWRYGRRGRPQLILFFAAAWIVTEWLRSVLLTGFPWNPLGVSLVSTPAAALSTLTGTYGLAAIVIILAGALLLLAERRWRQAAIFLLPVVVSAAIAALVVRAPAPNADAPLVRIVQPDIGQHQKWEPAYRERNFARLARLTGSPGDRPRLIFWPEAAVPEFLETDFLARRRIASLIGPEDMIMLGGIALVYDRGGRFTGGRNRLFAITPEGRIVERYDKAHLVPFGEYLPMRPALSGIGLSRLVPGEVDFAPGSGPRTLTLPGFGRVGAQICYEIIFSGQVVESERRPDFIFNPSNDAWFGLWGPPQHLAQARMRAIEEGLPVLRATPTGISAIVAADGRLVASIAWQRAGAVEAPLPPPRPAPPFARLGNILPWLFALLLAAIAIAVRSKAR